MDLGCPSSFSSYVCPSIYNSIHYNLVFIFIICIELLSNQVRKSPDIKGIYIEGKENKTSLFADDASFILDGSTKSFENLIRILDKFTNISGLKLNAKSAKVYA